MKNRSWSVSLVSASALLFAAVPLAGQGVELTAGIDVVSRYVWRGVPLSRPFNAQPWVTVEAGRFSAGTWGSHGFDGGYSEQDLWLGYAAAAGGGALTLTLVDYYVSDGLGDYFRWGGVRGGAATGAHTLELVAAYAGPETLPLRAAIASTFYNDPGGSLYAEVGFDRTLAGIDWGVTAGGLFRDGGFYGVGSSGLTNLAVGASRTLASFAGISLYASGWAVHDPELSDTYLILGFGF
jgi:hypothetical protein